MKLRFIVLLLLEFLSTNLFGQHYERYKKLVDTSLVSTYLGFEKHITITVPMEWQPDLDRTFPLVLVFDRQNQRSHTYILQTIDYLTSNEQMPASIVIGIESEQKYRYEETVYKQSNKAGLAAANEKFIFDELVPLAEKTYKASSFRLFIGHSRYGYFTSALLFSRIHQLNGIVSLSPFFSQKNSSLTDSLGSLKNKSIASRKYYRFGIGNDYPSDFMKMDSAIKNTPIPFLDAKGYLFQEADHNVTPGLTIGISLYEIFEAWARIQSKYISAEQKEVHIIQKLEQEIVAHYGTRLEFSLGILNGKGWQFYIEGQFEKAIAAWEILLNDYPNFAEAYLSILDAQMQLKIDFSQTIEKFKASLATSGMYTEKEKNELLLELKNLTK